MIYFYHGNNRMLLHSEIKKWRSAFSEKFGEENVIYISSLQDVDIHFVSDSLLQQGLFSSKRLVIIDGFPYSGEKEFSGAKEKEDFMIDLLEKIPEEVLVLFVSQGPDKRKATYKKLTKIAEAKEFYLDGEHKIIELLQKKFPHTSTNILQKIITLKGGNLEKSISEIEKLSVLYPEFTTKEIEEHISAEFEESIFVFIDTLLQKNKTKIFIELENLLYYSNFYAIYQSILANLRVFLYIEYLKLEKKSSTEISDILKLGNRAFLINKKHNTNFSGIQQLYENMIRLDKNMKSGKLVSSDEKYLEDELKNIFLKFLG